MAQLPIGKFLEERLAEYDSKFELRKGTGFERLFFKPMEFIIQPFRDEANDILIAQSFRRILLTADPDAFDEDAVDALASNLFVDRREGGHSSGVARSYFNQPVDREYPATGATFTGNNGLTYSNPAPFSITAAEMSVQIEEGLYFFDITIQSDTTGADTELAAGGIISLEGDTDVVRVTNPADLKGGLDRETNTEYITRVKNSIGVRDLLTGKGFNAILFENFANVLQELQPIGFGDDEMMRDILYNAHIGGKVDGYFKTPNISQGKADFVGILIDSTRQTFASKNVQLNGTAFSFVGNANVDRANGKAPVVEEIKIATAATFLSTANLSTTINLTTKQHVKLGVDGVFKNVRIAGVNPAATTRNEIVAFINNAFGMNVAFPEGVFIRLRSPTKGLTSQLVITNPDIGISALFEAFGLSTGGAPYTYSGDGPVTFFEGVHYTFDDGNGKIKRIVGSTVVPTQTTGQTVATSNLFNDPTVNVFVAVQERDVISITSGAEQGDYRVLEKMSNNQLRLDKVFVNTASSLNYAITRTGIKSGEFVYVKYYFNPLSIDIGKLIKLDPDGKVRGIRPGREAMSITDLAFLRITSIELIDAITREPLGDQLDGSGGYGQGQYGIGPYGIGQGGDYRMVVNSPEERFSMFEDSYIVINSSFQGLSVRVHYDYVPEIEALHEFVRSEKERILDGDMLMKHFIPSYVKGTIRYSVDSTDSSIPTNAQLTALLKKHIDKITAGTNLQYSDLVQFIVRNVDPFDRYSSFVQPFSLFADIHNEDGTISKITGGAQLVIPKLAPFPKYTPRPLSPRIAHWISDDLVLERV